MRGTWVAFLLLLPPALGQEPTSNEIAIAIRTLKRGTDAQVLAAARSIANWGPGARKTVKALVDAWSTQDAKVQEAVAKALRSIGPAGFADLALGLRSDYRAVRLRVAMLLAELSKDMKTVKLPISRLIVALKSEDPRIGAAVMPVFDKVGPEAVDPLIALFGQKGRHVRARAADALGRQGASVVPRLKTELVQDSPRRRAAAVRALGAVGPAAESAVPQLLAFLDNPDNQVRSEAVLALARIGKQLKKCAPRLIHALADPSGDVASSAWTGLRMLAPGVLPFLIEALADKNDQRADAVAGVLAKIGEGAVPPLLEAMASKDALRRSRAAQALGWIARRKGSAPIRDALRRGLKDPDPGVRAMSADGLSWLRDRKLLASVFADLLAAAKEGSGEVRAAAYSGLVDNFAKDKRVRALVRAGVKDADPGVRQTCLFAMARQGGAPEQAVREARTNLKNAQNRPYVRLQAAHLLGSLGRPARSALSALISTLANKDERPDLRGQCASALGAIAALRGLGFDERAAAFAKAPKEVRAAVRLALDWLAAEQGSKLGGDGRWDSDGVVEGPGLPQFDLGLTSLALLAFMAAGYSDRDLQGAKNPYAKNVREGLAYLVTTQTKAGVFNGFAKHEHMLYEHAVATHALCEAIDMTGDRTHWQAAQRALDVCGDARNPDLGWRYARRAGENDTNMTTVMLTALRLGDLCGFRVDRAAYKGASRWIDKMTDPNFGQVGYDYPGGPPSRLTRHGEDKFPPEKSQSMTAAAIWCRYLLGRPVHSKINQKGSNLCVEVPPVWDPDDGSIDMYYWHYGSLALYQKGGKAWRQWNKALHKALLASQRKDGELAGTWNPVGAWGDAGGRIYSTAIATLTLLTPYRYRIGFVKATKIRSPYKEAVAALRAHARHRHWQIREAAEEALRAALGKRAAPR